MDTSLGFMAGILTSSVDEHAALLPNPPDSATFVPYGFHYRLDDVMFSLWLVLGLMFGTVAGGCAFVITYKEYERYKLPRRKLLRHALSSAAVAALFFLLAAIVIGIASVHAF